MKKPDFTLITQWLVPASIEEVAAILAQPERLPDWWPQVYLAAEPIGGDTVAFHTRGWLPYTLRWQASLVEDRRPHGWTIAARGDLTGRGTWTLKQLGSFALVEYDWRIDVEKPLLKRFTPLLGPVYAANHRWAMDRGLEGLQRELVRRRAAGDRHPARLGEATTDVARLVTPPLKAAG